MESTLALSAAMPGLVGATLRRGCLRLFAPGDYFFGRWRDDPSKEGRIILKLFNLLVPELGPHLLAKGIWLIGEDLTCFLAGLKQDFWEGCRGGGQEQGTRSSPFNRA